jgi:release factor glutamine methyltransferase
VRLLDDAIATLTAAGIESPRVDAQLLFAHVLGVDRGALLTLDAVEPIAADRFHALVVRRAAGEPLQYLTGEAPFRYLMLEVGPGVFIPRPETELLVDSVLPTLRGAFPGLAVDLCSGSGAIALALAGETAAARVIAVERSASALKWLRRNCAGSRVEVVDADVADPRLLTELDERVDVVISNPPYVPAGTEVGREVAHDPDEAVFAGTDGLALMGAVTDAAARLLRPGGLFAVEHDDTQGDALPALLSADGRWTDVADHRDLTGRPRFATAVRR